VCRVLLLAELIIGNIALLRGNKLLWDYDPSQDEEIYKAYRAIRNAGVTIFDTADSYGTFQLNGRAEILLGLFERRYINENENNGLYGFDFGKMLGNTATKSNNKQQVATKFAPYPWRITRGALVQAAKESLERLEQDKLCIAQLHWSTAKYQPFQEGIFTISSYICIHLVVMLNAFFFDCAGALWEGIADIYDEGLAEAVGVSNYGPLQLNKFSERMKVRNVPIAVAQVQYSVGQP